MSEDPGPLLTITEAAERLRISPQSVYRLAANGALPSFRIGRSVRISEAALLEFLQECSRR